MYCIVIITTVKLDYLIISYSKGGIYSILKYFWKVNKFKHSSMYAKKKQNKKKKNPI